MRILEHPITEHKNQNPFSIHPERNRTMSKTSLFSVLFTAAMLCGILTMLAKLSATVESAAAAFPSAI